MNLSKGDKVDLVKEAGGSLSKVMIACGWDVRRGEGPAYDLDASILGVGVDNKALGQDWFVYYGHKNSPQNIIVHHGDNLTGAGDGDDEQITINLDGLPAEVQKLVIAVTIYEAAKRGGQTFSQVENAYVRVIDSSNNTELTKYDLSENTASGVNCVMFGELYRHDGGWKFKAVGDGFMNELGGFLQSYGLSV
ncbi:MAG TPA: TerD family protein [Magnetospirillaceae bacterium]|nr:TerD family protein [Magnetospirillaceae bacterium]